MRLTALGGEFLGLLRASTNLAHHCAVTVFGNCLFVMDVMQMPDLLNDCC